MRALGPIAAALIALLLVASSAMFTVDQRQNAIVFQLGEVKDVIVKPGLRFKWPLIQNVRLFDMRILTFDDAEPLRFITSEKKPVLVDSFVKWRIVDVRQYYVSVQGDEFRAQTRIRQTVSGTLRDEFGLRGVHEVVSDRFELRPGWKYIVSVGSVGQPRDYDPRTSYTLFNTDKKQFEFKRVDYDIKASAEKIFGTDLEPNFGHRLFIGV